MSRGDMQDGNAQPPDYHSAPFLLFWNGVSHEGWQHGGHVSSMKGKSRGIPGR